MSYKEWLYFELLNEGVIDEDEYTIDELDKDTLLETTELDELDFDNYEAQFEEHCKASGETPIWDLED